MKLYWMHNAAANALEWGLVNFLNILHFTANLVKFALLLKVSDNYEII